MEKHAAAKKPKKQSTKKKFDRYQIIILIIILVILVGVIGVIIGVFLKGAVDNRCNDEQCESENKLQQTDKDKTVELEILECDNCEVTDYYPFDTETARRAVESEIGDDDDIGPIARNPNNLDEYSFLVYRASFSRAELVVFDSTDSSSNTIWLFDEAITGRGGSLFDNSAVVYSPDGHYIALNKTGNNFLPFMIFDVESGEMVYSAGELIDIYPAYPAWISDTQLLFVEAAGEAPKILDVTTLETTETSLPAGLVFLRTNFDGTKLIGHKVQETLIGNLSCDAFDIFVYEVGSYDEISSVYTSHYASAHWSDNTSFVYQKAVACEETLFGVTTVGGSIYFHNVE